MKPPEQQEQQADDIFVSLEKLNKDHSIKANGVDSDSLFTPSPFSNEDLKPINTLIDSVNEAIKGVNRKWDKKELGLTFGVTTAMYWFVIVLTSVRPFCDFRLDIFCGIIIHVLMTIAAALIGLFLQLFRCTRVKPSCSCIVLGLFLANSFLPLLVALIIYKFSHPAVQRSESRAQGIYKAVVYLLKQWNDEQGEQAGFAILYQPAKRTRPAELRAVPWSADIDEKQGEMAVSWGWLQHWEFWKNFVAEQWSSTVVLISGLVSDQHEKIRKIMAKTKEVQIFTF